MCEEIYRKAVNNQKVPIGKGTVSQSLNLKQQPLKQSVSSGKSKNASEAGNKRDSVGNQTFGSLHSTANFGGLVNNRGSVKGRGVIEEDSLDYSTSLASQNLVSFPSESPFYMKENINTETPEKKTVENRMSLMEMEKAFDESADKRLMTFSPSYKNIQITPPGSGLKVIVGRESEKQLSIKKAKSFESDSKRMKEVLEKLNQDHIETKMSLNKFRLEKLQTKLEKVFSQERLSMKEMAFDLMKEIFEQERTKDKKVKS